MGQFPIVRAKGTLPGVSGQVRGNVDFDTGEGQVGQAVAGLGGVAFNIGMNYELRAAATERSNAEIAVQDITNRYAEELKKNPDYTTYPKMQESMETEINAIEVKHPFAINSWERDKAKSKSAWDKMFAGAAQQMINANQEAGYLEIKNRYINGTIPASQYRKILFMIAKTNPDLMPPDRAKKELIEATQAAKENQQKLTIKAWEGKASEDPYKTWDVLDAELKARKDGKGNISEEDLPSDDIQTILNHADSRKSQITVEGQQLFDSVTSQTALDWDKKLQAYDVPGSDNKLTYNDINNLEVPELEAMHGSDLIKFKEFWRGLLKTKIEDKDAGAPRTSPSVQIQVEEIIRLVGSRKMTLEQAVAEYMKRAPNVKHTDGDSYISRIFATEKTTRVPAKQILNDQLTMRQKQLRDAIEQQPNFMVESEGREILEELANEAIIELGDRFGGLEWENKDDLDKEVDRLIIKYSPSMKTLNQMVMDRASTEGKKTSKPSVIKNILDSVK